MAHKRKAVDNGSSGMQLRRSRRKSSSAAAAELSDVGRTGLAMASTNSKPKRNPRRAAKDRWEEEKLMTSDTSQLIDLDLVKLLAQPRAWNCLAEIEKEEILNLLPSDTHPDPHNSLDHQDAKIPPLPESFLRYSNPWRDGVRQFQVDLQNGRYDPRWLHDADEAMKQRAAGEFDKFKEQEFEEFWGQKQRLDKSLAAGQSSQVKLSTLIQHKLIRKGDVWKYSRGFSKGAQKILVEKEARIVEIHGSTLTFAVPPGERVFLNTVPKPAAQNLVTVGTALASIGYTTPLPDTNSSETDTKETLGTSSATDNGCAKKRNQDTPPESVKRLRGRPRKDNAKSPVPQLAEISGLTVEIPNPPPVTEKLCPVLEIGNDAILAVKSENGDQIPMPTGNLSADERSTSVAAGREEVEEVIIPHIHGLTALSNKILEIDGRIKDIPNGNAWKEFRSYRNNQDMGSLWEIRQSWFLRGK